MGLKLKTFREEGTEHLFHLRVMGSVLGLSGDVIAIGSQPARSARNLKVANIEGVSDERLHRGVGDPQQSVSAVAAPAAGGRHVAFHSGGVKRKTLACGSLCTNWDSTERHRDNQDCKNSNLHGGTSLPMTPQLRKSVNLFA